MGGAAAHILIRSAIVLSFGAEDGLRVSFRPISSRHRTIPQLPGVSVVGHLTTAGVGLRRLPGGAFALRFRSGPAVEIIPCAGRSVVVQTDRAKEVVRVIRAAMAAQVPPETPPDATTGGTASVLDTVQR